MKEINVAVTGGAGQIAYSLLPRLVSGETFGADTRVNLRLIEIPQVVDKLEGTIMELIDCGFNQTGELTATSDIREGVKDADWVLLVGSIPRGIVIDGKKIEERVFGTASTVVFSILNGANILRVHDYKEMMDVKKMTQVLKDSAYNL